MKRNHEEGQEFPKEKQGKHTGNRWLATGDHWDSLFTLKKKCHSHTSHRHVHPLRESRCFKVLSRNSHSSTFYMYLLMYLIAIYFEDFFFISNLFSGFKLRVLAFSKPA